MTNREKAILIKRFLDAEYGQVQTFLHFQKDQPWQFLLSVMLSAQATDRSVNQVTPHLFAAYPTLEVLALADPLDVERIVHSVGLAPTKSKNLVRTAKILVSEYGGQIPRDREKLTALPGVGYKTAGVFLGEIYDFPYIPVDTHVERVARTLGLVRKDLDRVQIEASLERSFEGLGNLINTHRQLILFGRTFCRPGVTREQCWSYIRRRLEEKEAGR